MKMLRPTALSLLLLASFTGGVCRADTMEQLQSREKQVLEVAVKVMGSVVAITSSDPAKPGSGSGVIVGKDGLILTAAHVTAATGKSLTIIFPDGRKVKGTALGSNKTTDSGMAKIDEPGDWPVAELGNSDTLRLGDWCVAMGHPGGFSYERRPPVRLGRVWRRDNDGAIFSNCPLIGGDSGGPLFDLQGRVIGINSSIHGGTEANRHVAIDTLRMDWDKLLSGKSWGSQRFGADPSRIPMTGATFDRESQEGVRVDGVGDDTPAAKAGLKPGDVVLRCNDLEVKTFHALQRMLVAGKPGDKLKLALKRGGSDAHVEIVLAKRQTKPDSDAPGGDTPPEPKLPEAPTGPRLYFGSSLEDAGGKVKVASVAEHSPAASAGLVAGDVLLSINDISVDSPAAAADIIRALNPGDKFTIKAQRGETEMTGESTIVEKK